MVPSEMIEEELQQELTEVKKRLVISETARARAVREFANIKYLLNQILLVEHFAVFDEVAAPLPPNWSDQLVHCMEIEATSHSKFNASQFKDQAEQENIADLGSLTAELARAKDDIHILQIDLRLQKSEIAALRKEQATAKQEIHTLQTKLEQVQGQYDSTHNLEAIRQAYSSELSRYHQDLVIAQNQSFKAQAETLASAVEFKLLQETLASSQGDLKKLRADMAIAEESLECVTEDAAALRTEVASLKDEKRIAMESLHSELKSTGSKLQAQIDSLKLQLQESRNSQLQKGRIEMAIAKEALKWISSDALQLPLPHFVGSCWMKQFEQRDCLIKEALEFSHHGHQVRSVLNPALPKLKWRTL